MKPLSRNRLYPTLRGQFVKCRNHRLSVNPKNSREFTRPRQQKPGLQHPAANMLDHGIGHLQIDSRRRRPVDR
jgi:hypothetical protein